MVDQFDLFATPVEETPEPEPIELPPPPPPRAQMDLTSVLDGFGEVPKPPYRIPSVDEIRKKEGTNGLSVVSTFSGAGGSCLGFRIAGYRVVWASEFVDSARETYLANFPDAVVDPRDIREVTADEIREAAGLREIDVLEGSPPCASFSVAGSRDKGWGEERKYSDTKQRVDDLFFEFSRLLRDLQPKAFVAENVPGLLIGKAEPIFLAVTNELRRCGYKVDARVLDAWGFGVPQRRRRLFICGIREDIGVMPDYPDPVLYRYNIEDAIPLNEEGDEDFVGLPVEPESDISKYAIGAEWRGLKPGEQSEKYFSLIRADPKGPCPTITQTAGQSGAAGVTHPYEERKFSIAEVRRLSGFPDDFRLTGGYQQQFERIGRAVPPPLAAAVAGAIAHTITSNPPSKRGENDE